MLEEFIDKVIGDGYISDYWLFEDEYIKEVRYISNNTNTEVYIYNLSEFLEENKDHPILEKLRQLI